MRKNIKNIILLIASCLALATSCVEKFEAPSVDDGSERYVSFNFEIAPVSTTFTKAEDINTEELDSFIDRLDVYEYDKDGNFIQHHTWENEGGLDFSTINFVKYDTYGNTHWWLFFANLHEDTANYLAQLEASEITTLPKGIIPLEPGNFRLHKPIMAGCQYSDFKKDESKTVTLYRYLTRIEIDKITADFDDESLMNADVQVKRIAITNYPNALRLIERESFSEWGPYDQMFLGTGYTMFSDPAFGNLYTMENSCNYWSEIFTEYIDGNYVWNDYYEDSGRVLSLAQYGGEGLLAQDYPYYLSDNEDLDKGVMVIDAEGDQLTASCHVFEDSEGILCSSTNAAISHSMEVNKVLYTIPVKWTSYNNLLDDLKYQDETQKLVIEVEINSTPYFYIISLRQLNANMIYRVSNITLKGLGSEYSNIYIKKYESSVASMPVAEWSSLENVTVEVGYKSDSEIY